MNSTPLWTSLLVLLALGGSSCHKRRSSPDTSRQLSSLLITTGPRNTVAGTVLTPPLQVRLINPQGNLIADSTETVTVRVTGGAAGATLSGTLAVQAVGGIATFFDLSIDRAGTGFLLDFESQGLIGRSVPFAILAGPTATFSLAPATQTPVAGTVDAVTVTALDRFGNTAVDYTGTVAFGSSDTRATLPGNTTFTGADQGVRTVNVTMITAGPQSLSATDTANNGITRILMLDVRAAATSGLTLLGVDKVVIRDVANVLTLTAQDPYGNRTADYRGTVRFTSNDPQAVLPANYTFVAADAGSHVFTPGLTLRRLGVTNVHVGDLAAPTIQVDRNPIVADSGSWQATTQTGAPLGRGEHTAVWTGTSMIVWGGVALGVGATNTGARYVPGSDLWLPTATANAPSERYDHRAVWTGTEMIVWGGGNYLNTGGRYDPTTNSWQATSTVNAPQGRTHFTMVWTGSEALVWGGEGASSQPNQAPPKLNTGARYNPASDSWQAISQVGAPDVRFLHSAVWTGTEMIVWGGANDRVESLATGGRYNPTTDTWLPLSTSNAPRKRAMHTAVWTGSRMITFGGFDGGLILTAGDNYDPATDTWSNQTDEQAPLPRFGHTAVWNGAEMVVWGGFTYGFATFNTGARYNPVSDSWAATDTTSAATPFARLGHTALWTGQTMIVWGGYLPQGGTDTGGKYTAIPH